MLKTESFRLVWINNGVRSMPQQLCPLFVEELAMVSIRESAGGFLKLIWRKGGYVTSEKISPNKGTSTPSSILTVQNRKRSPEPNNVTHQVRTLLRTPNYTRHFPEALNYRYRARRANSFTTKNLITPESPI